MAITAARDQMPPQDGKVADTERWSLIEHYEAIAAASRRMLDAARCGDWERVGREEDRCRILISGLKRADAAGQASIERLQRLQRLQRLALLRSILADDAEIRELSEPWLKQLEVWLGGRGDQPLL